MTRFYNVHYRQSLVNVLQMMFYIKWLVQLKWKPNGAARPLSLLTTSPSMCCCAQALRACNRLQSSCNALGRRLVFIKNSLQRSKRMQKNISEQGRRCYIFATCPLIDAANSIPLIELNCCIPHTLRWLHYSLALAWMPGVLYCLLMLSPLKDQFAASWWRQLLKVDISQRSTARCSA